MAPVKKNHLVLLGIFLYLAQPEVCKRRLHFLSLSPRRTSGNTVKGAKVMSGTMLVLPWSMVMFASVLDSQLGCITGGHWVGVEGTPFRAARNCCFHHEPPELMFSLVEPHDNSFCKRVLFTICFKFKQGHIQTFVYPKERANRINRGIYDLDS